MIDTWCFDVVTWNTMGFSVVYTSQLFSSKIE